MLHTKPPQTSCFKTTIFILLTNIRFGQGLVGKVCLCSMKGQQGRLPEDWRTLFLDGSLAYLDRQCWQSLGAQLGRKGGLLCVPGLPHCVAVHSETEVGGAEYPLMTRPQKPYHLTSAIPLVAAVKKAHPCQREGA